MSPVRMLLELIFNVLLRNVPDACTDGQTDRWTHGHMDRETDTWTDGHMTSRHLWLLSEPKMDWKMEPLYHKPPSPFPEKVYLIEWIIGLNFLLYLLKSNSLIRVLSMTEALQPLRKMYLLS